MRSWLIVPLLGAILALSCSTLVAEPARVDPPRSLPLQIEFSNTYHNDVVRVIETVWLEPYTVSTKDGMAGIRAELDEIGPKSEAAGRRFDGVTTWGLRWGFNFDPGTDSCSLRNATIEMEAVITLPELTSEDMLSASESELWHDYTADLRAHEEGHVNVYRAGAQELSAEILALGVMPNCEQLRITLSALGEEKIARIKQADLNFDEETGHGAIFPTHE